MKKFGLFLFVSLLCLTPTVVRAQSAAPEMFGVREVVIQFTHFDDPKAADACGLSREQIASVLSKALAGTTVPAIDAIEAKPPMMGVARIDLVPEISSHVDENMDCISWISLSAQNRVNVVIPPINTQRTVTAVYWRQHVKLATGQSLHPQKVGELLQKMAAQFAQQYRLDQPPSLNSATPAPTPSNAQIVAPATAPAVTPVPNPMSIPPFRRDEKSRNASAVLSRPHYFR